VHIKRGVFTFSLPFEREMNNVLGMRSGYTCCLANMHQGWTKFASHLWYATPGNGLAALLFSPSQTTAKVGASNTEVTINEKTDYPFGDVISFALSAKNSVAFPLHIRVPSWCKEATFALNGAPLRTEKGGQVVVINRTWKNGDVLTLQLPMEVTTTNWGGNSRAVERGPLVYALKLEERWEKGTDEREGEYFSVFPKTDWNYGLLNTVVKSPASTVQVSSIQPVTEGFIWNLAHAPVALKVPVKKVPDWKIVNDVAPQPVTARDGLYMGKVEEKVEEVTLIPYGCSKVRVVAFPVVK
jgi:hypothetical protein